MGQYKTEQESFWAGEFGSEYVERNQSDSLLAANIALFARVLQKTPGAKSIIEFGANIGLNLKAIASLLPGVELAAVEINRAAVKELKNWGRLASVYEESILNFKPQQQWDFVFTKGVLIHIAPDHLNDVYDLLHKSSRRFIVLAEYYNPSPVEVRYRGHEGKLFKRDFAGELLERHADLRLIDYGFCYKRDPQFPQDDLTWFLLEKTNH
jgi:pseudaminic acid biosynthesis-associated methylase